MEQTIANRARECLAKKDFDGAIDALEQALEKNTEDAEALALAGDVYAAAGDLLQATGHYVVAVKADPRNVGYKKKFINAAKNIPFVQHNPEIEKVLTLCLETPEVECSHAQILWYTIQRAHPQFLSLLKAGFREPWISFVKNPFEKVSDFSTLFQPLFLAGIKNIVVYNGEFEKFMTVLRRFLLEQMDSPQKKLGPEQFFKMLEAMAQYCFNTDYIFDRTEAEEKAVENLRQKIESDPAAQRDPATVGIYACYEPLYKLKTAHDIVSQPSLSPIKEVIQTQLVDIFDLQGRAEKIISLTEIRDVVSLKVRGQYEEFPYPRWQELPPVSSITNHHLSHANAEMLIAGCGTGQEALCFALAYPDVSILAVDLSRASLAYAAGKAEEYGIKNVQFRHADILQLGSALKDRKFDCISSAGVLHHMKDPLEGWKILTDLLKPKGFMFIGLYSAFARKPIVAAWEMIRQGNYPGTAAGMRKFRKDSKKLFGGDTIFDTGDYYRLNMYRDLLFHVQEHQFTLPQIKNILGTLGLNFLGMSVSEEISRLYLNSFPDDPKGRNIDNWHKLEEKNPHIFKRMYQFWCQKTV